MSGLAELEGKRVLILGFGREGQATLRFLRERLGSFEPGVADRRTLDRMSADEQTLLADIAPERVALGPDYLDAVADADVVIRAPGLPPDSPPLEAARQRGALVTSLVNLFFDVAPGRIVGVTGTKGKSTTTNAIYTVLRDAGFDARLGGNIGIPLLSCLEGADAQTVFVVELSSFQLSDLTRSPHVAVLQNVVREHVDYHGTFEKYVDAKGNLVRHQGADDIVVYNAGFEIPTTLASQSAARKIPFGLDPAPNRACFVEDGWLVAAQNGQAERVIAAADVPLPGAHNLFNVMPAIVVGRLFGIDAARIATSIRTLSALPHRMQLIHEWQGRQFFNDSLSTVPEAAMAAIAALHDRPTVLIAGGHDRGQEWTTFADAILGANLRAIVLLPETGPSMLAAIHERAAAHPDAKLPHIVSAPNLLDAVRCAIDASVPGTAILLSPAAASFGEFRNYEDRGNQFREAAIALTRTGSSPD